MPTDFIDTRDVVATIPKADDVDVRISIVQIAGVRVIEVQDITRSTRHVSRGWYCTLTPAGIACARELAAVMATLVMEEEM